MRSLLIFLVITALTGSVASARVVTGYQAPGESGTTAVSTPAPNNVDSATASPNTISLPSSFAGTTFNNFSALSTTFFVSPSAGTTEYYVTEIVTNNTGTDWTAFTISLIGPPEPSLGFAASPSFDLTPEPATSASNFSLNSCLTLTGGGVKILSFGPQALPANNFGIIGSGESVEFSFSIDVPDTSDSWSSFALTQSPFAVPEHSTLLLLATGAIGLLWGRRLALG